MKLIPELHGRNSSDRNQCQSVAASRPAQLVDTTVLPPPRSARPSAMVSKPLLAEVNPAVYRARSYELLFSAGQTGEPSISLSIDPTWQRKGARGEVLNEILVVPHKKRKHQHHNTLSQHTIKYKTSEVFMMMPNNIPFMMTDSIQQLVSNTVPRQQEEEPILLSPTPVEVPDKQVAESLFAKSIAAMKPSDREHAYDDIHAITIEQPEDPIMTQQSLERLEYEIEMREDNQAYQMAKSSNPAFALNRDFRLLFLRSDRFNAKKAAFRMVRHFQIKMELFGKEKLGRDIVQDDLDENDMKVLYEGTVQLLPTKDRGGRAIVLFGSSCGRPVAVNMKRRGRRLFYLLMVAARDANSFVAICYLTGKYISEEDRAVAINAARMAPTLAVGMPIHLAATHLGYDSEMRGRPVESVLKVTSSDDNRVRVRAFQGSVSEWITSLKSYGIPSDQVPGGVWDHGMMIEASAFRQMLRNRRAKERLSYPIKHTIKSPGPFDVLFGKGSRHQEHEGNLKLRRLIADCRKTYEKTRRGEKFILVQEIVHTVKQSTGLFLKEDSHQEGWIVVDDEAAAKKVGAVFRTMRATDY